MDTLQISKTDALKAFTNANDGGKKLLADLFGAETFHTSITDRVKTFRDACKVLSIDADTYLQVQLLTGMDAGDTKSIQAYAKLIIIIRALNEGWTPDWADEEQYKYYPWFEKGSGSGLVYFRYDSWFTSTLAGSRLCFKNRELAEYAGKTFGDIYNDFLNP